MSWLREDDDMLDHEKWRRAIREGGDSTLMVWWRLRAWCSRRLTDGRVPSDMVAELAQLDGSKTRARALRALVDASLLAWHDPAEDSTEVRRGLAEPSPRQRRDGDELLVVGYLQRNPSRAEVMAERERRAQAQRRRRLVERVTGHAETTATEHAEISDPGRNEVPARPGPARPGPLSASRSEQTRASPDATPLHREATPDGAGTRRPCWWTYPPGWRWSQATEAAAAEQGVTTESLAEHVAYWTTHEFARPVTDLDRELVRSLPAIRKRRETDSFKATRASPEDRLQRQADRVQMLREQEAEEERRAAGGVSS